MISVPQPLSLAHVGAFFAKSFDFQGRSTRAEYWAVAFYTFIFNFAFGFIVGFSMSMNGSSGIEIQNTSNMLSHLFFLFTLVPSIMLSIRRLHDTDHRGWWMLVPFYGAIVIGFCRSQPNANRFGSNPYGATVDLTRMDNSSIGLIMAVYVDDMYRYHMGEFERGPRTYKMSHMIADTDEELHAMADKIGVDRKWFQGDHYDITMTKRALAVKAGVVEITLKELAKMAMTKRRSRASITRA